MSLKIDQDHSRFRAIVRGKIRQNLRKYISQGELIGRKGKDLVSIPIPQIDIPHFSLRRQAAGRRRAGRRRPGRPDRRRRRTARRASGGKKAGQGAGEHVLEVDVTLDELAAILGEELELPDIQDKGKSKIINAKDRYTEHPPRRPRVAPQLQAHVPRGAEAPDRDGHVRRRATRSSSPSRATSATAAGRPRPSRSPTRSSST